MTNSKQRRTTMNDEGVSPVIAVILMVAITVVLAATVYVWVSGFATEDTGPEQAAATAKGIDLDDNGDVEWVQVTLTSGQNAPYDTEDVTFSVTNVTGEDPGQVCTSAQATDNSGNVECDGNAFSGSWDVGENLWVPCHEDGSGDSGNHFLTVSVRDSTILDTSVTCDEAAA